MTVWESIVPMLWMLFFVAGTAGLGYYGLVLAPNPLLKIGSLLIAACCAYPLLVFARNIIAEQERKQDYESQRKNEDMKRCLRAAFLLSLSWLCYFRVFHSPFSVGVVQVLMWGLP